MLDPRPMKTKTRHILFAAVAILLLVVAAYALLAPRTPSVATITLEAAPAERILAVNGRIRPRRQVDIKPSLGGTLVSLPFDVGDRVAAGDVLARIDDAPELAAIAQAEASAQAQEATLAQARRELARFEKLGQFATRQAVEQRRLQVAEGERELVRRRASVVQAREQRDRRVLRAPFAGVILERPVDRGQTVGLESIVYRLADLASPEVTLEVDEIYAVEIRPGMAATVSMPGGGRAIAARVLHIEPRVDPATGAREVRLGLTGGPADAPSGLTVTANLLIERQASALSVPRKAIIQSGGKAQVRIVGSDGVVAERAISFVDWPAEKVVVTGGLKAGERLLADPDAARPGDKVRTPD